MTFPTLPEEGNLSEHRIPVEWDRKNCTRLLGTLIKHRLKASVTSFRNLPLDVARIWRRTPPRPSVLPPKAGEKTIQPPGFVSEENAVRTSLICVPFGAAI